MFDFEILRAILPQISEDKDRLFTGSNDQSVRSYNIKVTNLNFREELKKRMCFDAWVVSFT